MTAITGDAYRAMSMAHAVGTMTTSTSPVFVKTALQPWQLRAVEKVARFRGLGPNWDSYGAAPPAEDALDLAMEVLATPSLPPASVPRVLPLPSGGIQLSWSSDSREVDVEIGNDLSTSVLLSDDDEVVFEEQSIALQPAIALVLDWLSNSN